VKIPRHPVNPSFHKAKGKSKNPKNEQIKTRVHTVQNTKNMTILTFQIQHNTGRREIVKNANQAKNKKGEMDERGGRET